MLPFTSQPYRVPSAERIRVVRSLGRGVRPLALNAVVLIAAFAAILGGALAALEPVMRWVEARSGDVPEFVIVLVPVSMFAVPWFVVYLVWRRIWFAIIRRRVAALAPEVGDLVAKADEAGLQVEEVGLVSSWMAWSAVTRLMLVGETLVVARGAFGLMVSLEAIGGRPALAALVERVSPAAMAASDRRVHDAVA